MPSGTGEDKQARSAGLTGMMCGSGREVWQGCFLSVSGPSGSAKIPDLHNLVSCYFFRAGTQVEDDYKTIR